MISFSDRTTRGRLGSILFLYLILESGLFEMANAQCV